jgi:hypothetical protein
MTEQEWLACGDLWLMLEFLRTKASDRKLRLVLCAWSRWNWQGLVPQSRSAVEVAERFADRIATDLKREDADAELLWTTQGGPRPVKHWLARLTLEDSRDLWPAAHESISRNPKVQARQIDVLRDVFGNPFRPPMDAARLARNGVRVLRLAQGVYQERLLPEGTFDRTRLAELADALEQAGCRNDDMLGHLRRQDRVHVRGCWVVDFVLNRA